MPHLAVRLLEELLGKNENIKFGWKKIKLRKKELKKYINKRRTKTSGEKGAFPVTKANTPTAVSAWVLY